MRFSFYRIDADYCDFLRESDPCVPYTMETKSTRPFIGIVLSINGYNYYSPLTSPKPKHLKMKNQIDFFKIDQGRLGAINFNNMIPVHPDILRPVEMRILPTDDKATNRYKNLLANQLSWCNTTQNTEFIIQKACKLYNTIVGQKAWPALKARCCDFLTDERQCMIYCEEKGLIIKHEIELGSPQTQECSTKQGRSNAFITQQVEPPVFEP